MNARVASWARLLILGAGVVSSWSALIVQFRAFYATFGTFLHVSEGTVTNPFLTPCLYGSLAFLGAFFWASALHLRSSARSEVWLSRLLLFGMIFAAVVMGYECADYFHIFSFGVPLVCAPNANPLTTPCFRGLIFFILAYLASFWMRSRRVVDVSTI